MLGVHYMTAYRYVRSGALPAQQRNGHWYVATNDLEAFVATRAQTPSPVGRPRKRSPDKRRVAHARRQAEALAQRLMAGDQRGAWRLVEAELSAGGDMRQINSKLLTPALRYIGDQWAAGNVSVGDEHRASVIAMRLISLIGGRFNRRGRKRGTVVVSAVPGDRHGLPTAIMADMLRSEGFNVVDLGADTPSADIVAIAAEQDRLIAVGLCATSSLKRSVEREIRDTTQRLRAATGRPVLLGGSGLTEQAVKGIAPDHHSIDADDAMDWFLNLAAPTPGGIEPDQ